jgi:hypothetical protein
MLMLVQLLSQLLLLCVQILDAGDRTPDPGEKGEKDKFGSLAGPKRAAVKAQVVFGIF